MKGDFSEVPNLKKVFFHLIHQPFRLFFINEFLLWARCLQHNIISRGAWYMKSFQSDY